MISGFCYFNGKIVSANESLIHPDDLGVLRGYGVFDVMKTVNGKIFLFDEHFKRLSDSADYMGVRLPAGKKEIENVIKKLTSKNKIKQASIRIVLTGGGRAGAMPFYLKKPTFFIFVFAFRPL